ncbi:MAG: glycosyltransferase [Chloroflexi bacterium]|jgi:glycosyltransferase involved in cell wall biosynthesis|nr:glycosyltransferase [Chloroflexota bacterium]
MTLTLSEITVVILTLNEEANLQRCLDSTGWAADRVVIDSGSTDATLEIARKNKVRYMVRQAKPFLISEQRNWALENAAIKTEWTLFIDADEVIPERLRQELQQVLATAPAYVTGYRLTPQFMFLGRWLRYCQGYPNWHDRLVRTGRGSYSGGVWEHFVTDGQVGFLREPYLHFSLNKGIGDWFEKHLRYATAEAEDVLATLGFYERSGQTRRKRKLRNLAARVWPLRPIVRFAVMYLLRRGFLDGLPGFLYSLMIMCYEYIVILKIIELKRRSQEKPL